MKVKKTLTTPQMLQTLRESMARRRVCPITRGFVTRRTEDSFQSACFLNRGLAFMNDSPMWCDTCRGAQRPVELEIVTLEELSGTPIKTREEMMAGKNKKNGTCGSCKAKGKTLKKHYDEMVCTSCQILRISCRQRPEIVLQQLAQVNGGKIPGGNGPAASEYHRKAIVELVAEKENLATEQEQLRETLNSEHNTVIRLTSELDETKSKIAELKQAANGRFVADDEAIQGSVETIGLSGDGFDMVALQEFGWRLIGDLANSQQPRIQVEDIRLLLGHNGVGVSV